MTAMVFSASGCCQPRVVDRESRAREDERKEKESSFKKESEENESIKASVDEAYPKDTEAPSDEKTEAEEDKQTETEETTKTERTSQDTSGAGWVDPYEYFQVENIFQLYKALKRADPKPTKVRVTPHVYNVMGEVKHSNKETFEIDLTAGAQTEYETVYIEENYVNGKFGREEFTILFIGDPDSYDLMTVTVKRVHYKLRDGEEDELDDNDVEENLTIMSDPGWEGAVLDWEPKAIGFRFIRTYKFFFTVSEMYFP